MTAAINPFLLSGYRGSKYFCDRENETRILLENITNGRSSTLVAIRRIGKTGLIRHVLAKLPKDFTGIYLDILSTENRNDFLNKLSSAVYSAVPEKSAWGKKVLEYIKSLRPVMTFDPLTGQPQFTFRLEEDESSNHIGSIIRHLEQCNRKIVMAIDEFQQILKYPEANTDAWLRSIIQPLNNITFIFSGSQQHLITDLFSDPKKPFFRSSSLLGIDKIEKDKYASFIRSHLRKAGKHIDMEVTYEMLQWADMHTYYVQLLCNRVFALKEENIRSKTWKDEAGRILQEQQILFFKYRDLLSKQQWLLMKAMAQEGMVFEPTSKSFISKYNLGSPSTVLRSLEALLHKEMIYTSFDSSGTKYYCVYDVLFRRWI
jgi:AAA+ ATPase superfamily predicted ATPase